MHDYHAVEALVERVASGIVGTERIAEVRIRAGAEFSPEALEQAYEMLTLGTPLEGSRLVVEPGQDERECLACGNTWGATNEDLAGHWVVCPCCGAPSAIEGSAAIEVLGIAWGRAFPPATGATTPRRVESGPTDPAR